MTNNVNITPQVCDLFTYVGVDHAWIDYRYVYKLLKRQSLKYDSVIIELL